MDDDRFAFAVDALYGVIDLPAPLASEVGALHTMSVDDVLVTLTESSNGGAIIVSATVGTLAEEEPARSQDAKALLREGFALTADNAAALTVDGEAVVATAMVPLRDRHGAERQGQELKRAVEDVLERVMIHGPQLSSRRPAAPITAADTSSEADAAMIFRP
ncbi:MAG: hypothetical protein AAF645_27790 [Myxococcota bacterium]